MSRYLLPPALVSIILPISLACILTIISLAWTRDPQRFLHFLVSVRLSPNLTFHTGNVNLGYTLNKGCSEICPRENINVNLGVASVNSYCCQSSFCNISTAGLGLRASIPMLGLGLLLSLLALLQLEP